MNDIDFIREACIKANPELLDRKIWGTHEENESDVWVEDNTIRLADVLLAMRETDQSWYVRCDGVFFKWEKFTEGGGGHHGVESTYIEWNLRTDDILKQPPETLKFLASLLAGTPAPHRQ